MHNLPVTPLAPMSLYGPRPAGWAVHGLAHPNGVLPPPPGGIEARELGFVRAFNQRQTPQSEAFTTFLAEKGADKLWWEFARQYRSRRGFIRGWLGTGLVGVAMGVAALRTKTAKRHYDRLRPFQVDPSIRPIGPVPRSASYPSGHASTAYSAATTLSALWPARAYEFHWWARQVGLSRMAAGMHFPSDVKVGALLGQKTGHEVASILY